MLTKRGDRVGAGGAGIAARVDQVNAPPSLTFRVGRPRSSAATRRLHCCHNLDYPTEGRR